MSQKNMNNLENKLVDVAFSLAIISHGVTF